MLDQPDPVYPMRGPENSLSNVWAFRRPGFVSLWIGSFASVEEAQDYFGIPDEIGVYLPAEAFAADIGAPDFPPENLEVNFEQVSPRPLYELLHDTTYSASFLDRAVEAAFRQGIDKSQGAALIYDFDYRLNPERRDVAGPVRFIDAFAYVETFPHTELGPWLALAPEIGYCAGAVLFVQVSMEELCNQRRRELDVESVRITAREHCEYLLSRRGKDTIVILRDLGLCRSEDVGRIVFGTVDAGIVRAHESDSEADYQGLFELDEAPT